MSTLLEHRRDVKPEKAGGANDAPEGPEKLKDPVCGMAVTAEAAHHLEHEGRPYYFCSADCQSKFAADPSRYIAKMAGPDAPATTPGPSAPSNAQPAAAIYTCPMHPEIRQDHPGNCPKCGMTLEPVMPTLDDDDENPELASFTHRFWWTLPLTAIVASLSMFGHSLGWFDMATQSWIELVLSLPVVLWAGWLLISIQK